MYFFLFFVSYATNWKQTSFMNADCYNCYNCIILVPIYSNIRKWENPLLGKFDVYSWHVQTTTKLIFYLMIWDEWQEEKKYCRFMFSKHGFVLILHVYIVTFYEVQIVVVYMYMSRISGLRIMSWLCSATRLSFKLYMHIM